MTDNHDRSVADLRRESERTRADLLQAVGALRTGITEAASPTRIQAEVTNYVAEKGQRWIDSLKQQARDNPMQALAAGTAVAVPALKLARAIPLPLWMIGAGLALTSPRVRNAMADALSSNLEHANGALSDAEQQAEDAAQRFRENARAGLDGAQDTVAAKASELRENASKMAEDARDRAARYVDAARATVDETVASASNMAKEAVRTSQRVASDTLKASRRSAESMAGDHPGVVAGLGLAIGALIAASLPSTTVERKVMGDASDALRDTATETLQKAKSAAADATGKVGDRVSAAVDEATEELKNVSDEAITTAFEPSQSDHR